MENFRDIFNRFAQFLGLIMVLVYASLGFVFLMIPEFYGNFKGMPRYILGILLIFYAVFRAYRVLKSKLTL